MADPLQVLPLLVIAVLLMSVNGVDAQHMEVTLAGDETVTTVDDVLVVGGGTATIPANATVEGSVYLIGGETTIAGTVEGDVVQVAGTLRVVDGAAIRGELQSFGGEETVAAGARVAARVDPAETLAVTAPSPAASAVSVAGRTLVFALLGWLLARRRPTLLRNAAAALTDHAVVSGTVGLLATVGGVAVVVFMGLTVVLLPVSVLAVAVGLAIVGYVHLVVGYVIGRRLSISAMDRATAVGVGCVVLGSEVLGWLPLVGDLVTVSVLLVGVGAVLLTYFGARRFEPVVLPA